MLKNRKFMKNCGLFMDMAKRSFCFFQALMLLWLVFCVSGKVGRVYKNACFPSFWGFVGWLILVYLGLEGLGVFVFLAFVFLFLCWFCFCFVCFVLVLLLDCFWCWFFFCFCFFFFCFLFVFFPFFVSFFASFVFFVFWRV